jgi:hypothetical protein
VRPEAHFYQIDASRQVTAPHFQVVDALLARTRNPVAVSSNGAGYDAIALMAGKFRFTSVRHHPKLKVGSQDGPEPNRKVGQTASDATGNNTPDRWHLLVRARRGREGYDPTP